MKTLIISDLHAGELKHSFIDKETGLNARLLDIKNILYQILEYAKENKVKNIIIGGDIYNVKNPKNFIRYIFASILVDYLHLFDVYIITGNHDQTSSFIGGHALSETQQISKLIPNLHIISKPKLIPIGGIEFAFFPYVNSGEFDIKDEEEFIKWNKNQLKKLSKLVSRKSVLIGHFETDKSLKDNSGAAIELSFLNKLKFNLILLGHVHNQQALSKKVYHIGSIVKTSFNEEGEAKYFAVIDHDDFSLEFIEIEDREFKTFRMDLTNNIKKFKILERKVKKCDLKELITRVVIKIKENDLHLVNLKRLDEYLKENSWKYVGMSKDIVREDVKETQLKEGLSVKDILKVYIEENEDFFGSDSEDCLEEGLKILISQD